MAMTIPTSKYVNARCDALGAQAMYRNIEIATSAPQGVLGSLRLVSIREHLEPLESLVISSSLHRSAEWAGVNRGKLSALPSQQATLSERFD